MNYKVTITAFAVRKHWQKTFNILSGFWSLRTWVNPLKKEKLWHVPKAVKTDICQSKNLCQTTRNK